MGQAEMYMFLKKHTGVSFTTKMIYDKIQPEQSINSIRISLKKLLKLNDIFVKNHKYTHKVLHSDESK